MPWALALPIPVIGDLLHGFGVLFGAAGLDGAWSIILSMGLLNGVGTLAAALFGSCFPTTVYIGHPGWKAMGARSGYSIANGAFWVGIITLGLAPFIARWVPVEAGAAIVVWIAIIITAQAFSATPPRHAPAVAFGLFPALAAWVVISILGSLRAVGVMPGAAQMAAIDASGSLAMTGALHLWSGFLFTCTIWAAMGCHLVDGKFRDAATWAGIAALLAAFGVIHGFEMTPTGPVERIAWGAAGWEIPACHAAIAGIFMAQHARRGE